MADQSAPQSLEEFLKRMEQSKRQSINKPIDKSSDNVAKLVGDLRRLAERYPLNGHLGTSHQQSHMPTCEIHRRFQNACLPGKSFDNVAKTTRNSDTLSGGHEHWQSGNVDTPPQRVLIPTSGRQIIHSKNVDLRNTSSDNVMRTRDSGTMRETQKSPESESVGITSQDVVITKVEKQEVFHIVDLTSTPPKDTRRARVSHTSPETERHLDTSFEDVILAGEKHNSFLESFEDVEILGYERRSPFKNGMSYVPSHNIMPTRERQSSSQNAGLTESILTEVTKQKCDPHKSPYTESDNIDSSVQDATIPACERQRVSHDVDIISDTSRKDLQHSVSLPEKEGPVHYNPELISEDDLRILIKIVEDMQAAPNHSATVETANDLPLKDLQSNAVSSRMNAGTVSDFMEYQCHTVSENTNLDMSPQDVLTACERQKSSQDAGRPDAIPASVIKQTCGSYKPIMRQRYTESDNTDRLVEDFVMPAKDRQRPSQTVDIISDTSWEDVQQSSDSLEKESSLQINFDTFSKDDFVFLSQIMENIKPASYHCATLKTDNDSPQKDLQNNADSSRMNVGTFSDLSEHQTNTVSDLSQHQTNTVSDLSQHQTNTVSDLFERQTCFQAADLPTASSDSAVKPTCHLHILPQRQTTIKNNHVTSSDDVIPIWERKGYSKCGKFLDKSSSDGKKQTGDLHTEPHEGQGQPKNNNKGTSVQHGVIPFVSVWERKRYFKKNLILDNLSADDVYQIRESHTRPPETRSPMRSKSHTLSKEDTMPIYQSLSERQIFFENGNSILWSQDVIPTNEKQKSSQDVGFSDTSPNNIIRQTCDSHSPPNKLGDLESDGIDRSVQDVVMPTSERQRPSETVNIISDTSCKDVQHSNGLSDKESPVQYDLDTLSEGDLRLLMQLAESVQTQPDHSATVEISNGSPQKIFQSNGISSRMDVDTISDFIKHQSNTVSVLSELQSNTVSDLSELQSNTGFDLSQNQSNTVSDWLEHQNNIVSDLCERQTCFQTADLPTTSCQDIKHSSGSPEKESHAQYDFDTESEDDLAFLLKLVEDMQTAPHHSAPVETVNGFPQKDLQSNAVSTRMNVGTISDLSPHQTNTVSDLSERLQTTDLPNTSSESHSLLDRQISPRNNNFNMSSQGVLPACERQKSSQGVGLPEASPDDAVKQTCGSHKPSMRQRYTGSDIVDRSVQDATIPVKDRQRLSQTVDIISDTSWEDVQQSGGSPEKESSLQIDYDTISEEDLTLLFQAIEDRQTAPGHSATVETSNGLPEKDLQNDAVSSCMNVDTVSNVSKEDSLVDSTTNTVFVFPSPLVSPFETSSDFEDISLSPPNQSDYGLPVDTNFLGNPCTSGHSSADATLNTISICSLNPSLSNGPAEMNPDVTLNQVKHDPTDGSVDMKPNTLSYGTTSIEIPFSDQGNAAALSNMPTSGHIDPENRSADSKWGSLNQHLPMTACCDDGQNLPTEHPSMVQQPSDVGQHAVHCLKSVHRSTACTNQKAKSSRFSGTYQQVQSSRFGSTDQQAQSSKFSGTDQQAQSSRFSGTDQQAQSSRFSGSDQQAQSSRFSGTDQLSESSRFSGTHQSRPSIRKRQSLISRSTIQTRSVSAAACRRSAGHASDSSNSHTNQASMTERLAEFCTGDEQSLQFVIDNSTHSYSGHHRSKRRSATNGATFQEGNVDKKRRIGHRSNSATPGRRRKKSRRGKKSKINLSYDGLADSSLVRGE